ncbi:MAG TPA: NAD kinase [Bacteroidia bacterium]|nr:NAD kinase [Bacteroidia bacterium]
MKVAIYGRITENPLPSVLQGFFEKLEKSSTEILVGKGYLEYLSGQFSLGKKFTSLSDFNKIRGSADVLLSLGGDGTLLETITYVRNSGIPVLGINTGRLGFLAGVTVEEALDHAVERLKGKKYSLDKRTLVKLETKENLFGEVNYALNEFTVQGRETSAMLTVHTTINGEFLGSYWADGLIVATPTGSTAYSLSCGGPLMVPDARSFVITPLSPHNLNVRPLIVPDDSIIKLTVEGRSSRYLASLDARSLPFDVSTELTIRKEDFKFSLIRFSDQHFFQTIRQKLLWGSDTRN